MELERQLGVFKRSYEREKKARIDSEKAAEKVAYDLYSANVMTKALLGSVVEVSDRNQNLNDLLTEFLSMICKQIKIPVGHIFAVNPEENVLTSLKIWHVDPHVSIDEFIKVSETIRFKKGEGLVGRVWANGASVWIPNIHKDDNFPRLKLISNFDRLQTGFAIPIKIRGSVTYIFEFFLNEEKNRISFLVELIETIGRNIQQIIESRIHREELAQYLQNLERANNELTHIKEQVFHSAKLSALGEMASGIAHEINNPLTIISGKLAVVHRQLRKLECFPEDIAKDLLLLENTVDRIGRIVNSMRNLSKDSSNEPMQYINVKSMVQETLDVCESKMVFREIDFKVAVEDSLSMTCRPAQLAQVLLNLINNAIDAVESTMDRKISLSVFQKDSRVYFTVEDNGSGIPLELRDKVFQPFFTTKPIGQGTGLGLSISRKVVEDHKGELIYDFQDGRSIFSFFIPLKAIAVKAK